MKRKSRKWLRWSMGIRIIAEKWFSRWSGRSSSWRISIRIWLLKPIGLSFSFKNTNKSTKDKSRLSTLKSSKESSNYKGKNNKKPNNSNIKPSCKNNNSSKLKKKSSKKSLSSSPNFNLTSRSLKSHVSTTFRFKTNSKNKLNKIKKSPSKSPK